MTMYMPCTHEIERHLLLGRKVMTNLDSILKSRDITLSTKVCLVKAMVFPVVVYGCEWSHSVMSNSLRPRGMQPTKLLNPWDSLGKNTGVDCHFLLQGTFLTQGSNPGLPHCRKTLLTSVPWMWELNYKESWAPKNWCFWTVVLEKILESPLDCKESQPVHPKGDQSWMFIGRTYVEAETPILWSPDAKNWLIRKDPDAGKDWRQEEKGMTEDKMDGWHYWLNGHESG